VNSQSGILKEKKKKEKKHDTGIGLNFRGRWKQKYEWKVRRKQGNTPRKVV